MDFMSINDLTLESIRAVIMLALLATLFLRGSVTSLGRHPGWRLILVGFCLITVATLFDITDEIPGLERYVIIGDTIYEAFIEKLPGYLLGFTLLLIGFYRMVPSLLRDEANEKALQESEQRFRQIFVANPDPVILARLADGAVLDVNPAFEQQTGFSKQEVLGRNSEELNIWHDPQMRLVFRRQLQEKGSIDNLESVFRLKNRPNCPGLLSARVVNLAGEPSILIVIRDITPIKQAEQALREVDQIRSDFISTAAHELRTPLSVLIGYADLLNAEEHRDRFTPQQRHEFIEEIRTKGLVLSQIVDDLLDISKMDAGSKFDLKFETFDLGDLLARTFEQFRVHTPERRFDLDLSGCNSQRVECDRQRLQQVLENLLSNSVKYSKEGSLIRLNCRDRGETVSIEVVDEGIGMTAEQIDKIFDKFYRVDASNTAVGGLGLGMSIVKQIVDALGGVITIDSQPGEGTRVRIALPKKPSGVSF